MTDNLITKIAKAALDVGGKLEPDKRNKEQNYDYLSADKILSLSGQALFSQGVVIVPRITEQATDVLEYTDKYNNPKRRYDSRVGFVFLLTDGVTNLEMTWFGIGSDFMTPDKALYKAVTSGHKYFLMKLLCIGAGNEDGEHEAEEETVRLQRNPANGRANAQQHPPIEPVVVERKPEPVNTLAQSYGEGMQAGAEIAKAAKPANGWDIQVMTRLAEKFGLVPQRVRGTLAYCNMDHNSAYEELERWMTFYKAARDNGLNPPEAGEQANSEYALSAIDAAVSN